MTQRIHTTRGVSIIEAIVVISVVSVSFAALLSAAIFFLRGGLLATDQAQALFLLDESFEAIRFLRDGSFSTNITPLIGTGTYYLEPNVSGWATTNVNTPVLEKFTRSIVVSEVYRKNSDNDIVPASSVEPKTIDTGTVKVDVVVSWQAGTVQGSTYLSDLYEN